MIDINLGIYIITFAIMIFLASYLITAGSCFDWAFNFTKYISLIMVIIGGLIVTVGIIEFWGVI